MLKTLLLSVDLETGAELFEILDRAGVKPSVALWMFAPEYEDWRIFLSGRRFDQPGVWEGYRLLHNTLSAAGLTYQKTPQVMILPMTDPFIRNARRLYSKSQNVQCRRLGGQTIGGRFIEDAYVYRIS
ncbi:MAG: hypothetical protein ACKV2U_31635 [Bryobacteraceae bacterium]